MREVAHSSIQTYRNLHALEAGMEGGGGGGGEEVEEELASIDIDPRMQRQLDLELVGEG
uniref:Uncharacterized protein n=1 Tax=Oryza sativa subsp. japonica TaxID=39947 RepID=Q69SJ6_ORYSJ|nr:hypothetical protein [Oryza sativa Japonica Group]